MAKLVGLGTRGRTYGFPWASAGVAEDPLTTRAGPGLGWVALFPTTLLPRGRLQLEGKVPFCKVALSFIFISLPRV